MIIAVITFFFVMIIVIVIISQINLLPLNLHCQRNKIDGLQSALKVESQACYLIVEVAVLVVVMVAFSRCFIIFVG